MSGKLEFKQDMSLELTTFAHALVRRVHAYYQDPEHRKEFEDWYKQKYGKEYEWRNTHEGRKND